MRGKPLDLDAVNPYRASLRRDGTSDGHQGRGLPSAIAAQQRDGFTGPNAK
jgi:hypothetical protein